MPTATRHAVLASALAASLSAAGCGGPAGAVTGADPAVTAAARVGAASPCRRPLPAAAAALALPAGEELELALDAVGVQIYACTATAAGPAWVFSAPEANLYDREGHLAGTHFAGPTWQAQDGSAVVAARVAGATVDPTSIPWLLLRAVSHAGTGRLAEVTSVQRLATAGGLAPATGCDAAAIGAVARVPYTATYCFAETE